MACATRTGRRRAVVSRSIFALLLPLVFGASEKTAAKIGGGAELDKEPTPNNKLSGGADAANAGDSTADAEASTADTYLFFINSMSTSEITAFVNSTLADPDATDDELAATISAFMGDGALLAQLPDDKLEAIVDGIPVDTYAEVFPIMINSMTPEDRQAIQQDPETIAKFSELFVSKMPADVLLDTFNSIPPKEVAFMLSTLVAALSDENRTAMVESFILEGDIDTVIESFDTVEAEYPAVMPLLLKGVPEKVIDEGLARADDDQRNQLENLLRAATEVKKTDSDGKKNATGGG